VEASTAPEESAAAPAGISDRHAQAAEEAASPAHRRVQGLVSVPAWLYFGVLGVVLAAMAAASWLAWRQTPHPDMFRFVGAADLGRLDWWLHPVERNAFKRLVVRVALADVFGLPGTNRLWAVGRGGLIIHSADGGRTWVQQHPAREPTTASTSASGWSLLGVAHAASAEQPSAAQTAKPRVPGMSGMSGMSDMADQGGLAEVQARAPRATLAAVEVPDILPPSGSEPSAGPDLQAVFFADTLRGWAVGFGGTVLSTVDGGRTWRPQRLATTAWLQGVSFLPDGQRGWVVGLDGTVLATADGGKTWNSQPSGTSAGLRGIAFLDDGQRGWAVGDMGTVLATADGGKTWVPQPSGTSAGLRGMAFLADGQRGWAVGSGGTVLATADAGRTWGPQTSGTSAGLQAVTFLPDGQRGWAVGHEGAVLATVDGGQRWEETALYEVLWPPWYLALLTLGGLVLALLIGFARPVRGPPRDERDRPLSGVATTLVSDEPVSDKARDLLGYKVVVDALSGFMRNRATEPRLTVAVTGEWGSGKSSVMRMLQTDLARAGFCTAWFNAWHQQQEDRPLAALFNTIRQQAVPSFWRRPLAALRVRSRLIWGRGGLYRGVCLGAALGVALLAGDLLGQNGAAGAWQRVAENVRFHVLQHQPAYLGLAGLRALDPFATPAPQGSTLLPLGDPARELNRLRDNCTDPAKRREPEGRHDEAKRQDAMQTLPGPLFCGLALHLMPDSEVPGSGLPSTCRVRMPVLADGRERCVFQSKAELLRTIEAPEGLGQPLNAAQRQLIASRLQTLEPPAIFRGVQSSLLSGAAAFLLLLLTKGYSVYGLQLLAPLKSLVSGLRDEVSGKESAGTVERYRHEFKLLCEALDGRLVVFIDDLDRCTPQTVNAMLELTNYLVDVGRCFVVLGAAMDRVKKCVRPPQPEEGLDQERYATEYLRKLVHIELPVPLRQQELHALLDTQSDQTRLAKGARHDARRTLRRLGLATLAVAAATALLVTAFLVGQQLHGLGEGRGLTVDVLRLDAAAAAPPPLAAVGPPGASASGGGAAGFSGLSRVGVDGPQARPQLWSALLALGLVLAAALGWRLLQRYRETVFVALGGSLRVSDSPRFMDALRLWGKAVAHHDPTPRQVKRFYNRARLLAAYEHEVARQPGFDPAVRIDEAHIVAMTALHQVRPKAIERAAAQGADGGLRSALGHDPAASWVAPGMEQKLDLFYVSERQWAWPLLDEHRRLFGREPDDREIKRFASRVQRIHVR